MKEIIVLGTGPKDVYSDDVVRIVSAMAGAGYKCSEDQAVELWVKHSDSLAAGWLGLPMLDEDIVESVRHFFVPA